MSEPTLATIKRLYALSGNQCAFPGCSTRLVQDNKVVGRVAHIRAKSPGGPRSDPAQSNDQRNAFENLLLLCPIHHDVVDADTVAYSVERLLEMKRSHEGRQAPISEPADAIASALLSNVNAEVSGQQTVVVSHNQSGGITAGTVNINAAPEPQLHMREVYANQQRGAEFQTQVELALESPISGGKSVRSGARSIYQTHRPNPAANRNSNFRTFWSAPWMGVHQSPKPLRSFTVEYFP